jgi:hypothetical protein
MLNQRRCCHCGGSGPFARVTTCQDGRGEVLGYLCLCARCDEALSEGAFRERLLDHLAERRAPRCPAAPAKFTRRGRAVARP